jgi:hypothetical protein
MNDGYVKRQMKAYKEMTTHDMRLELARFILENSHATTLLEATHNSPYQKMIYRNKSKKINMYSTGKIYALHCNKTDRDYIGSTVNSFSVRLKRHETHPYETTAGDIIAGSDYEMRLIEDYPCNTKRELEERERFWIEILPCVNHNIPTRSKEEYAVLNRDYFNELKRQQYATNPQYHNDISRAYRDANREHINAKQREYHAANREHLNAKSREYHAANQEHLKSKAKEYRELNKEKVKIQNANWRESNADTIKLKQAEYYEQNKDRQKAYKSTQIECECGRLVTKSHLAAHLRSRNHKLPVNNQPVNK